MFSTEEGKHKSDDKNAKFLCIKFSQTPYFPKKSYQELELILESYAELNSHA